VEPRNLLRQIEIEISHFVRNDSFLSSLALFNAAKGSPSEMDLTGATEAERSLTKQQFCHLDRSRGISCQTMSEISPLHRVLCHYVIVLGYGRNDTYG